MIVINLLINFVNEPNEIVSNWFVFF